MKILVTGSSGYIGSELCGYLTDTGMIGTGLDRRPGPMTSHVLDVRQTAQLKGLITNLQPDIIVHLAGRGGVGESVRIPEEYLSDNVAGTMSVFTAARDCGNIPVLFASSSSVYGYTTVRPTPETAQLNPMSPYAATKAACEMLANSYSISYGMNITAMRFFTVVGGAGREGMAYSVFSEYARRKQRPWIAMTSRDYIHILDLCRAIYELIRQRPVYGFEAVNIGAGSPTETVDLWRHIAAKYNAPQSFEIAERSEWDISRTHADISKINALTGWAPIRTIFDT
jgi:UDP-glucuronate 4-epimerase